MMEDGFEQGWRLFESYFYTMAMVHLQGGRGSRKLDRSVSLKTTLINLPVYHPYLQVISSQGMIIQAP